MKPLRLLQRRIIATNLFFVLILLLGILTALFLNARARSMKEAGRYLAAELRFAGFFSEHESEASSSSDEIGPPPDGAQAATAYYPYVVFSRDSSSDSYTVSRSYDLNLSDADTARLQSLLQRIADSDTGSEKKGPPERPGENESLTPAFSSYYYLQGRQAGKRVFLVTSLDKLNASLLRFALQLGGIFLLAGFLIFGLSFFLARMSLRPVEHAFSEQQRFVQDASHELKTPLTVILANLSILKSRPAATIQEEMLWIQNTETEARRMQELTERLLFLAKADSKRLSPKIERLSLSQLTEAAALPFTALAFERGLTLDTEPEAGISVKGDARALTQLLAILIDNALKYARSGSVVTVRLARQKKHALLSVHNEGEVIPQDALPHLFDRFYRVDKSRARAQGGYGLGLSIAKTIAHAHGGDIRVESSAKHGTCFTTTLPLSE
ncbi:sensor histidine kinase [Stomatobaculum longum]|uniref:sensor histidine kinase n=1 Tax=Stomatobaculum longum TaxID=796942 RepID=UPI0028D68B01|nr:HAMP domain-containing sensor histidine kinase [Stomatobaculum longum]